MVKRVPITIPTEPIGSIPRPPGLIEKVAKSDSEDPNLTPLYEDAIRDTIERFEATGSPVVTDGEQRKYHNFATYCVHGLPNTAPDGFKIPFSDGHTRRLLRLARGPFRYRRYALRSAAGIWVTMSVSGVVARRCRPQLPAILCASERLDVATACPKENFDGSRQ